MVQKNIIRTYIDLLKEQLGNEEVTKIFKYDSGYIDKETIIYYFDFRPTKDLTITFRIQYNGNFNNIHSFQLSFSITDWETDDYVDNYVEEIKRYLNKKEEVLPIILRLYRSFLKSMETAFQTHRTLRLYMIMNQDSFRNTIKTSGIEKLLQKSGESIC